MSQWLLRILEGSVWLSWLKSRGYECRASELTGRGQEESQVVLRAFKFLASALELWVWQAQNEAAECDGPRL